MIAGNGGPRPGKATAHQNPQQQADTHDSHPTLVPGGNTKPLPASVSAALAKATATTAPAPAPNPVAATEFDQTLRREARTVAQSMIRFKELIAQAQIQHLHEQLGFPSWTAYIADVIANEMTALPVNDRRRVVALLAGEGMSQRVIAQAVGVSQSTVRDDVAQVSRNYSPDTESTGQLPDRSIADAINTITGRDGKHYPRPQRRPPGDKPKPTGAVILHHLTQIMPAVMALNPRVDKVGVDNVTTEEAHHIRELLQDTITECQQALDKLDGR
ncbi:helix-turn-helix domain-containing protein [Mycolicibacterium sp. 050232]|uniref:helix-turn-helix domain-containing protein n=1 Tax=Mycolicibacterium sp. 050232 TaxID=3113982 RepID=UPI002E28A01D|nr:helix-turn-helix domain-containing protein [Mycolicibacterium sp. 050232]MED5814480.1 helix-turn-helix domain-containing protein [Mycolicibacterium sp. 050232]